MKKNSLKRKMYAESAITLISLVVTIIVLLILAGVSLNLVSGGNGILARAAKAVDETTVAKEKEQIQLVAAACLMDVENCLRGIPFEYFKERFEAEYGTSTAIIENVKNRPEEAKIVGLIKKILMPECYAAEEDVLDYTKITYNESGRKYYVCLTRGLEEDKMGQVFEDPTNTVSGTQTNGGNTGGGSSNPDDSGNSDGSGETTGKIPQGLEIGSTVSYTPSGTYDEWSMNHSGWFSDYKLASGSSYNSADETLTDMTISSWKVFDIEEDTGKIKLVPSVPTTETLILYEADGYNNAVKLLNDACSSLYGNGTTIIARSINIEDIEKVLTEEGLEQVHNQSDEEGKFGEQYKSAYTTDKTYPAIYAEEINSVITPIPQGKNKTLDLSDSPSNWVTGSVVAGTSINPYRTYYKLSKDEFTSQLKAGYDTLLLPNGKNTNYWVASRSIYMTSFCCAFGVRSILNGSLSSSTIFNSTAEPGYSFSELSLFPLVSMDISLIRGNATSGWSI